MSFQSAPIYVFVVAGPLLCLGFEKLVQMAYLGIRIVGTAGRLDSALQMLRDVRADLMVVDDNEHTGDHALELAATHVPVLLLTAQAGNRGLVGGHVAAVVSKSDSPATLLRAIERACARSRRSVHLPAPAQLVDGDAQDADQIRISRLTARERELIAALLCSDTEPAKIIAHRLCISEQTLRNHLSSIYGKVGVHSRLGLHAFAVKHGLHRMTQ